MLMCKCSYLYTVTCTLIYMKTHADNKLDIATMGHRLCRSNGQVCAFNPSYWIRSTVFFVPSLAFCIYGCNSTTLGKFVPLGPFTLRPKLSPHSAQLGLNAGWCIYILQSDLSLIRSFTSLHQMPDLSDGHPDESCVFQTAVNIQWNVSSTQPYSRAEPDTASVCLMIAKCKRTILRSARKLLLVWMAPIQNVRLRMFGRFNFNVIKPEG